MLVAGEASGDALGAGLIEAARRIEPGVRFEGIAGPAMRAAGCEAWRDSGELAVMGLFEVLRHLPRIAGILRDTRRRLAAEPPDLLVGIDAPDFNLRIERFARGLGIPTVQYVSPTVWAWRPGRVRTLRAACDRVLCLFPFEAEFLGENGIDARFVGHPLADEIPADLDRAAARRRLGLGEGPLVALLPGSRAGEVARLGGPFAGTAAWLASRVPGVRFAAPMIDAAVAAAFRTALAAEAPGCPVTLFEGRARDVIAASDAVLAASGTATLEAMLVNRPLVVAYRVSSLTYRLVRALDLVRVENVAMPNLLAGETVAREFLQDAVRPDALGPAVLALLSDPAAARAVTARFATLRDRLGQGASDRAARAVLELAAARGGRATGPGLAV